MALQAEDDKFCICAQVLKVDSHLQEAETWAVPLIVDERHLKPSSLRYTLVHEPFLRGFDDDWWLQTESP